MRVALCLVPTMAAFTCWDRAAEEEPEAVSLTEGRKLPPHDPLREWSSAFGGGKQSELRGR